jgi:hypothetical protein
MDIHAQNNAPVQQRQHGQSFGCVYLCRPGRSLLSCPLPGCSQAPWPRIQARPLSTAAFLLHRLTLVCSMCILPSICKFALS